MSNENLETFKATAKGKGWPTSVSITGTNWNLQMDEPKDDGGTDSGANPMQYFIASLAGCQNEQAQVVAEELSIDIKTIDLNVEVDLDLSGFMGEATNSDTSYKAVRLKATVSGSDLTNDKAIELGKHVAARCPILALLRAGGAKITSEWIGAS
jgi:putative redox protein